MGRPEELLALNTATMPKRYRFTLSNAALGTLVLKYAPDGWKDDEYAMTRNMKYFGVFRKFSQSELKFIKDGRDYLQSAYEAYGVNADVSILVEYYNTSNAYTTRFNGKIDFSTYKINELSCDVQVKDASFVDLIMSRIGTKVNILNPTSIDGTTITAAHLTDITIPDIEIAYHGALHLNPAFTTGTDSHVVPVVVVASNYATGVLSDPSGAYDTLAGCFMVNIPADLLGTKILWSLKGSVLSDHVVNVDGIDYYSTSFYVKVKVYSGSSWTEIDSWFFGYMDPYKNRRYFQKSSVIDYDLYTGDYVIFEISSSDDHDYTYENAHIGLYTPISTIPGRVSQGVFYKEAFRVVIAKLTGLSSAVASTIFNNVFLGLIMSGRSLRNQDWTNRTISITLEELFNSLSIFNIGMGIQGQTVTIERMSHFFDTTVVLDLSGRINESLIEKSVIPELYANRLQFGFNSYDYDFTGGIYEFNTASFWSTVIKPIDSEFAIISPFRADTSGIFKALLEEDNEKDIDSDEDIFILDCVGDESDLTPRTDDGFDSVTGAINPSMLFNLDYSPARILRRWGSYIRGMLHKNLYSFLRFQGSDKNTTLSTTKTGETEVTENADIQVSELDTNLWIAEAYTCEVPLSESDIVAIQSNPYGLIKLSDTKLGWILEYKSKNENKKSQYRILRCNLDIIVPTYNYGKLYNYFAVVDSRGLAADGWHVMTETEWAALVEYLGGESVAGGKLKETGTTHWTTPNTGATNEVGFNAVGGGYRSNTDGAFAGLNESGWFWCADNISSFMLDYNSAQCLNDSFQPQQGRSVRLAKDSTTLSNGQTGNYTGNDGKTYWTKCINGVEYLAENLRETKFADGSLIPEITDGTAWSECASSPAIGSDYEGGKLFYKSEDETWGLVVTDGFIQQEASLTSGNDVDGCTYTGIGEGYLNNEYYIENNPYSPAAGDAFWYAHLYSVSGYDDWFLPSKDEMQAIIDALPSMITENDSLTSSYDSIDPENNYPIWWAYYDGTIQLRNSINYFEDGVTVYAIRRVNLYPGSAWCNYNNDHDND